MTRLKGGTWVRKEPKTPASVRYGHLFPELDEAIATSFDDGLRDARGRRGAGVGSGGEQPSAKL